MHLWQVVGHDESDVLSHRVAPGFGHALLSPMVAQTFESLEISAAVWDHDVYWKSLHAGVSLLSFEREHGRDQERHRYNSKMFARVLREKRALRGSHAGLSDLFAPILAGGKVIGILVCGPFTLGRPTSVEMLKRWRWLTGRRGHLAEPDFAAFLSESLKVLVLEGEQLDTFERLVACLTGLMAGEGHADELANRAEGLRLELEEARSVDRMWEAARTMVDDRSARMWQAVSFEKERRLLGLSRTAEDALVGLLTSRTATEDALEESLRREAFLRSSTQLARRVGDVVAGRVGDRGVVFLSSAGGSAKRRKQRLLDLAGRAASLGRREGLELSFGLDLASGSTTVSRTYRAALQAAENARAQGTRLLVAQSTTGHRSGSLRELRHALARVATEQPEQIAAEFERYLEAVGTECGPRVEAVRGHLDAAFERIVDPCLASGVLDEKGVKRWYEGLDRASTESPSASDLFAAYRQVVKDIADASRSPVPKRRDRALRAAIDHLHQHYAEPLSLERIAKVAGFSQDHFSKLFKEREGTTFEQYLRGFRVEQAKRLLLETRLGVARVAELTGFHSAAYFCRAFRELTGVTPLAHRKKAPFRPKLPRRSSG